MGYLIFTLSSASVVALWLLYRLIWSPLSRLPGPRLCAVTRLPLILREFRVSRRLWIHDLHVRYGPIVRIAPDEVSFASASAIKEIYSSGGSGYDKSRLYPLLNMFDTPNMFSTTEKARHAERRRAVMEGYTKAHVMSPEVVGSVQQHARSFVKICTENTDVDVFLHLNCYALDCATAHIFEPHGSRSLTTDEDREIVRDFLKTSLTFGIYCRYYLPGWIARALTFASDWNAPAKGLMGAFVLGAVRRGDVAEHALLHHLLENTSWTERSIASECMDHTLGGADVTANVLCFLLYHLSLPSACRVQERLRGELRRDAGAPLDELPYLEAVVKEGLRCWSPGPGIGMPRIVPEGGRVIDGVFVPQGTIVSCSPYTTQMLDGNVWPDADKFVPERWLSPGGGRERERLLLAFSAGGRGCVAKAFAYLQLKMLLKEVYSEYRSRVSLDMRTSMEMEDQAIASRPKGGMCLLTFEKVREEETA